MSTNNATPGAIVVASSMKEVESLATRIAKSELVPVAYRNKPDDIFVAMLMGNEIGIGPMQAIQNIDVIEGRPQARARLKKVLSLRNPNCEYFRCVETSTTKATFETKRRNDPEPTRLTYTIEEATAAGLTRKANWMKNPAAMLRARCEGALADIVYSDSTLGVPAEEYDDDPPASRVELKDVTEAPAVKDVSAPAPNVTKRADEVKAILEQKKSEVQDAEFKADAPAKPKTAKRPSNIIDADANGNPLPTSEKEKPPPPVGEQVTPRVEPPAVSGEGRVQPEAPKEQVGPPVPPQPDQPFAYDKCLALAKLRGLKADELKAALKTLGAAGPKSVTEEHYKALCKKYPAEPGDDELEPAAKEGDLF
jgi:hypothetical protein